MKNPKPVDLVKRAKRDLREKAQWESVMLLDVVDIATAIVRLSDSIAVAVCNITKLRNELIVKLTGAAPESTPAAIKAWQEMSALQYHEEWPMGAGVNLPQTQPKRRKRKRR